MALALFDDVLLDAHRKHEAHVPRIEAAQNRAVVESMQSGAQPVGQPLMFRVLHPLVPVSWMEEMNSSNLPLADKGKGASLTCHVQR